MGSLYLIEKRINMEYEEAKAKIVEGLEKKNQNPRPNFILTTYPRFLN